MKKQPAMKSKEWRRKSGGFIHLINSGAACLDASGTGDGCRGQLLSMKPWYEVTEEDQKAMLGGNDLE